MMTWPFFLFLYRREKDWWKAMKLSTVLLGSCDYLGTGVQDLKAVKFSEFVHMSEIEERSLLKENTVTVCSVEWHSILTTVCEVKINTFSTPSQQSAVAWRYSENVPGNKETCLLLPSSIIKDRTTQQLHSRNQRGAALCGRRRPTAAQCHCVEMKKVFTLKFYPAVQNKTLSR